MNIIKAKYLNILNDSFEYLKEAGDEDKLTDRIAAKGKLAFLAQAVFGYPAPNEWISSLMAHQTILIIQMIQSGEHFEQFQDSDVKKVNASFILSGPFFSNKLTNGDKMLVLGDPTSVKWTPYQDINFILDSSKISTPFIIDDHPGITEKLYIPEKEWNDFLDAMIEFAQDEYDAITCGLSLLH